MTAALCVAGYMLIVGGLLYGNHKVRLARPRIASPRVPFTDDDGTQWIPFLPPCPPPTRKPAEKLHGFELDARFYGVIAPSFPEYH